MINTSHTCINVSSNIASFSKMYLPALFKAVPFAAINVVALFGNTLVCLSVYRNTRLRSKIGTVILALAVTDLISALTVIPLSGASMALGDKKHHANLITGGREGPLCYLQGILFYALTGLSMSLMALAALIRYLCVVKTDYYQRYVTTKSILCFIGVMTAVMLTMEASVLFPKFAEVKLARKRALCFITFSEQYKQVQTIMFCLICTIWVGIPVVVGFVCYTLIFCHVKEHNKRVHCAQSNAHKLYTMKKQLERCQTTSDILELRDIPKEKRAKERNETTRKSREETCCEDNKSSRQKTKISRLFSKQHKQPKASSVYDFHHERPNQMQSVSIARKRASEAKVTKTILAVIIGFACCWSVTFITMFDGVVYSSALSSAVNPLIYGAADRRFRQTYKKILTCKRI